MVSTEDITGRRQLGRNVLSSWLSYLAFVVFGFIMPRAIDGAVGQAALGVWDLSWTFVSYLSLAMIGIGSSVNRYVARYRASGDVLALCRVTSSVIAIQILIAGCVLLLTVAIAIVVPRLFGEQLGDEAVTARWVVLLLGSALSVQMAFDAYRGILTGCHRWGIYNALNAGSYSIAASGMLIVLASGGGLKEIAAVHLAITVITELVRVRLAKHVCPEINFKLRYINRADIKKVVNFGVHSILLGLPRIITIQTVNIIVVAQLGPGALAVLARPLALVAHISTLVSKFSGVLTPTVSSLQGGGQKDELKTFAITAMRVGWIITVLPLTFLMVLGDRVIDLWMGPGYVNWKVMVILAAGSLLPVSQSALIRILVGLNEHGRVAKIGVGLAAVTLVIGLALATISGWDLVVAAFVVVIPLNVGTGLVALVLGCRQFDISFSSYWSTVLKDPFVLLVLSLGVLLAIRVLGPENLVFSLCAGLLAQMLIAGLLLRRDVIQVAGSLVRSQNA